MTDDERLLCYQSCATKDGRAALDLKKKNNKSKGNVKGNKIAATAEECAAAHCGGTTRSFEEETCTNTCYEDFGKEAAKATNKAYDKAVDDAV